MNFETFGGVKIFRSSSATERGLRTSARTHLLTKFRVGEYRDPAKVNDLIQHQYSFFAQRLEGCIPKLVTNDALQFVLFQYDEASRILHGHGISDPDEKQRWERIEGGLRRALKYLAEMICLVGAQTAPGCSRRDSFRAMDQGLLCAEMMVDLAEMSHRTYTLFPSYCVARVFPAGGPVDWVVEVEGRFSGYDEEMMARMKQDRNHRTEFITGHQIDLHGDTHAEALDPAFLECFGWSYGHFASGLGQIVDGSRPAVGQFPTLFIERKKVIDLFTANGAPQSAVERMLAGFTVYPDRMQRENRVLWNPKQENRAFRRGFFECQHETGPHLAFSREMARENLVHLAHGVCYKRLPEDWYHPKIEAALEALSLRASLWFEDVVRENVTSLDFTGGRAKTLVGTGQSAVPVPTEVGEIDFIGYSSRENLLLIVEAKMVNSGLEGKFWRDDVSTFVTRNNSYAEKFRRKIAWAQAQRPAIALALNASADVRVVAVMVTLYPCIAKLFIDDFPCVSICEFMTEYRKSGGWPYRLN